MGYEDYKGRPVFYLYPENDNALAKQIINDPANSSRHIQGEERMTIRLPTQNRPGDIRLACFRRLADENAPRTDVDVILPNSKEFSSTVPQCDFMFDESADLILRDTSRRHNTHLKTVGDEKPILASASRGGSRQCVVFLGHDDSKSAGPEWIFEIGPAKFRLKPPAPSDQSVPLRAKLDFARRADSIERTIDDATRNFSNLALDCDRPEINVGEISAETTIKYARVKDGKLGGGSQGEVYHVVDTFNGTPYACKIRTGNEKIQGDDPNEVRIIKQLGHWSSWHANIVKCDIMMEITTNTRQIFMPLCKGNLKDLLNKTEDPGERKKITEAVARQMSGALKYLHALEPAIIHRDVKPSNILYEDGEHEKYDYLLADFGVAVLAGDAEGYVGTEFFVAPEVKNWRHGTKYTTKADIYSLGVTLLSCLCGPAIGQREIDQWENAVSWCGLPPPCATMLAANPNERYSAAELVRIFEEFDVQMGGTGSKDPEQAGAHAGEGGENQEARQPDGPADEAHLEQRNTLRRKADHGDINKSVPKRAKMSRN
ncbi:kinase-like domain-containing protein [Xylariaceae sp. FL0255]|nr:kinase-like domain-containing protein [Xylariaceae sp. FL0255]